MEELYESWKQDNRCKLELFAPEQNPAFRLTFDPCVGVNTPHRLKAVTACAGGEVFVEYSGSVHRADWKHWSSHGLYNIDVPEAVMRVLHSIISGPIFGRKKASVEGACLTEGQGRDLYALLQSFEKVSNVILEQDIRVSSRGRTK
jgi:hypothetical protein